MNQLLRLFVPVLLVGGLLVSASSAATTYFWNVPTGEFGGPASNWTPAGTPVARDNTVVNNGGVANVTTTYAVDLALINVGAIGGDGTINIESGGTIDLLAANQSDLLLGYDVGTGTANLKPGGVIQNLTNIMLGQRNVAVGIFNQTGGTATTANLTVGYGATGRVNISDGTLTATGNTFAGLNWPYGETDPSNNNGYVTQTGGTVNLYIFALGAHGGTGGACDGGYYNQSAGVTNVSSTMGLGATANAYGYYNLSGTGQLYKTASDIYIGGWSQTGTDISWGTGLFEQSGDTLLDATDRIIIGGGHVSGQAAAATPSYGVFNLSGGTVKTHQDTTDTGGTVVGGNLNATGVLNISGGLFEVRGTATRLAVGWKASGATGGGTGIVNIGAMDNGGGTLAVGYIERSDDPTAVALINFHGGTLKARYDTGDFLKLTTNCVYAEDAVIDTDGHDVTVLTALEAPAGKGVTSVSLANTGSGYTAPPVVKLTGGTGFGATAIATVSGGAIDSIIVTNPGSGYAASDTITVEILGSDGTGADGVGATVALADNVSGGLTKKGPGTLRLNADNTYTGATLVEAGTLLVDGSITSDVAVMADALLGGTGTVTGDVVVATGGSVAPGASVGSLAVTGDLAIDGTLDVEFNSDTDAIDLLAVSGGMDLSGATISFADLGTSSLSLPAYVFATYGSITGDPATLDGTPAGYVVDYAYAGKQIALVAIPEPTTLAMLLGVMIGLLAIRRK